MKGIPTLKPPPSDLSRTVVSVLRRSLNQAIEDFLKAHPEIVAEPDRYLLVNRMITGGVHVDLLEVVDAEGETLEDPRRVIRFESKLIVED